MPTDAIGSITITPDGVESSLPIAIDWRLQIESFLCVRLPAEDVLFARWIKPEVPNPLSCGNAPEYLTPPYPPLPSISIGELQWPSGASRYARALYAVDWDTMLLIAKAAWGYEPELDDNGNLVIPVDVPDAWGTAAWYSVQLDINSSTEGRFRARMRVLLPYRVPGSGSALWLLPLVDDRYMGIEAITDSGTEEPASWDAFITSLGALVDPGGIVLDSVDPAYGSVDPRLWKTIQPQRAAQLLDVAALTVGRRVVRDPMLGKMRLLGSVNSLGRRNNLRIAKDSSILAGGLRGVGSLPAVLDVYCQRNGKPIKKSAFIAGGTVGFARLPTYSTWESTVENDTQTMAFVAQVSSDVTAWANSGGQYSIGGAWDYLPNGFDDFLSITLRETESEKYALISRVYELPNVFLPIVLLAGGVEPQCQQDVLFKFILLENMTGGSGGGARANADIYEMDGAQVEAEYPVENSLNDFSHLVYGNDGLCIKVDDKYWIIHPDAAGSGGGGSGTIVKFTLSTNLTSTAAATVQATSDAGVAAVSSTITVSNYSGYNAYSGAVGTAVSFDGSTWFVIEVNRRPNLYEVALTCDSHAWTGGSDTTAGFSADQTDPITYSLNLTVGSFPLNHTHDYENLPTIKNPRNLCWVNGDNALVERVNDSEYRVVKVLRQKCLRFRFLISSDVPTGQTPDVTASAISPLDGESGEPPSGILTLKDRYGRSHNGKSGQKGIAAYDFNRGEYFVEDCQHVATLLTGQINATASSLGTSSNIVVKNCVGLNGTSPSGTVNVKNIFGWASVTLNNPITFYWNPVAGEYQPHQMQCNI